MFGYPLVPPPSLAKDWISGVPIGVVCPYAGQISSPFTGQEKANVNDQPALWIEQWGWMLCDGRELGIAAYHMLYAAVGNLYGGDGQYTFCLPDYRGLFLRCMDDGKGVDPQVDERLSPVTGEKYAGVGSIQWDALEDHQHSYLLAMPGSSKDQFQGGEVSAPASPVATGTPIVPDSLNPANPKGNPASISSETRPRNIYVNYIIKYR